MANDCWSILVDLIFLTGLKHGSNNDDMLSIQVSLSFDNVDMRSAVSFEGHLLMGCFTMELLIK